MDGLDRITLVLLVVLAVVALLFPLTEGHAKHRERQIQDKREN